MGNSVLVLLYAITAAGQYALSRICFSRLRFFYPLSTLNKYQPFTFLRAFPVFRALFKERRYLGGKAAAIKLMAFSSAALINASILMILAINHTDEYPLLGKILLEAETSAIGGVIFGVLFSVLLFLLEYKLNIWVQSLTIFCVWLILLPSLMLNWLAPVALVATMAKVSIMIVCHYFLQSNPTLRKILLNVLSILGIVKGFRSNNVRSQRRR